ncbi:hypothetical protein T484DRAFT_2467211 [Baffinella frigidus]|nr:hypothetical protein T484DRAFT_2467211 [Cryptophyta sp. CCMP2293]
MKSVTEDSAMIVAMRASIEEDLQKACLPLREYIRQYDAYLEFMNMDLTEYVRSYEEREGTLQDDEREIEEKLREKQKVADEVPQFINLGMFNIKLDAINSSLIQKYDALIRMIMSIIAEKAASKSKLVVVKFATTFERLKMTPTNIEEVAELEELITEIPKETEDVRLMLDDMLLQFEVLDRFNFQLSDEQFGDKWEAYGWPRRIEDKVGEVEAQIVKDRNGQQDEMKREQVDFEQALDDIEQSVNGFHQHSSLDDIGTIGPEVRNVVQKLKDFAEQAKKFQSREILFGLEQTDYDRVARIAKTFEPYAQLWVSADDWLTWHKKWLSDPFESLDPEQMEKDVGETWRALFKAAKTFADLPECQVPQPCKFGHVPPTQIRSRYR